MSWICPKCGETVGEALERCWNCRAAKWVPLSATRGHEADAQQDDESAAPSEALDEAASPGRRVAFRHFTSTWTSWEGLFQEAADFASRVGPERLISISHSEDQNTGVVTVWYWEEE